MERGKRGKAGGRADGLPECEAGGTAGYPPFPTVKRTVCLSPLASELLRTQAFGEGVEMSAIVERLVLAHCRDYELKFRGEKVGQPPGRAGRGGTHQLDT